MEIVWIELLLGFITILLAIRYYLTKDHDYWIKRKIPGPKPIPLFGTFMNVRLGRVHIADYVKSVYDSYPNEPAIGIFVNTTPTLVIKDLDMIKDTLVKSFRTFSDRGVKIHADIEPLQQHILFSKYDYWKVLRRKLTPTLTSGKIRKMYYLINECNERMASLLENLVSKDEIVDCFELSTEFTLNVVGVCAFGQNLNALASEDSEFRKYGLAASLANTWLCELRALTRDLPRWMSVLFKPILRDKNSVPFFVNNVRSMMDYRKKSNIRRHDFIDILMDIREYIEQVGEEEMSDVILTCHAYAFFLAGFETSSTTLSHAMYELALNPNIQDEARKEVQITFERNDGKLSYDALKNMKYLDKVFQETLRKYPPVPGMPRAVVSDYTFADSKISMTKGTKIFIPVYSIHHDPKFYPDPEKFDPERFNDEAVKLRPEMSYLPFGHGPRICIGDRFALCQLKLGLATIIRHFKLEICDKTFKQYVKRPGFFVIAPKNGVYLRFKKL